MEISQNFVTFSEYMNFNSLYYMIGQNDKGFIVVTISFFVMYLYES